MQQPVVWLVEDEISIAETLIYMLQQEGFAVKAFERGLPVLEEARRQIPALAILDVGLPDISGFELCRQLLAQHPALPVLFLTARSDEVDKLLGLEIGADDYVAKPFSPREVCARVRTILRRMQKSAARSEIVLLLKTLLHAPGRVYSRQQLMDKVWGEEGDSFDRTVDTHIKTLRAKLRAVNDRLSPISTHRGMGYSLGLY